MSVAKKSKELLVVIENGELKVSSFSLAKGLGVAHRSVKLLIDKYEKDFEEVDGPIIKRKAEFISRFEIGKKTEVISSFKMTKKTLENRGRSTIEYILTEGHVTFLGTLLRAKPIGPVIQFRKRLSKEFIAQRRLIVKLIVQQQNADWHSKRESGKIERREETDVIKEFVAYAERQGSKNANKYYMIISKMENEALFSLEFVAQSTPNIRDIVEGFQLYSLMIADRIVAKALKDGMAQNLFYKEIYSLARDRVVTLAASLGKTPVLVPCLR